MTGLVEKFCQRMCGPSIRYIHLFSNKPILGTVEDIITTSHDLKAIYAWWVRPMLLMWLYKRGAGPHIIGVVFTEYAERRKAFTGYVLKKLVKEWVVKYGVLQAQPLASDSFTQLMLREAGFKAVARSEAKTEQGDLEEIVIMEIG